MTDITLRPFTESDAASVQILLSQLQHHEMTLHPNRLPWNHIRESYWQWMIEAVHENDGFITVAEKDGQAAGVVIGWVDEVEAIAEDPAEWRHGFIQDIVVAANFRGQGIGRALMQAAEQFFAEAEVTVMRVCALANNEVARKLYMNVDMQPYEIIYEKKLPLQAKMARRT